MTSTLMPACKPWIVCVVVFAFSLDVHADCELKKDNDVSILKELKLDADFDSRLTKCPVERSRVRRSDALASDGGGFYARRTKEGACHFAVDLEAVPKDKVQKGFGKGQPVMAAAGGKVALAQRDWDKGAGSTVIVEHGTASFYTLYAHLDAINVKAGQKIEPGQVLGTIGYSGNAKGLEEAKLPPHVHFVVFATKLPLAQIKPIAVVKEAQALGQALPFMNGYGFIDPTRRLATLGCFQE